jgi:hypothetical protein
MAHKQRLGLPLAVVFLAGFRASFAGPAMAQITGTGLANVTNTTEPGQTINPSGSIVLSVSVASADGGQAPTGMVTFEDITLDQTVAIVTLNVGTGEISTATTTVAGGLTQGDHQIVADYSGDANYAPASSQAVTITVAMGETITTVTATPPALAPSTPEALTATIAPAMATNGTIYIFTGTVNFYDNGATLLGTAAVAGNVATLSGVPLANNISHSITALYSGDVNWLSSVSTALTLAATTLPDSVVLTSNAAAATPGQVLVLSVSVTPNSTPAVGGEQNPTGSVVFYYGTTSIGTAALSADALDDGSTAALTTERLPGGQDTIYASYKGDLYYDAELSNLLTLAVEDFSISPAAANPPTNLNIVQGSSGSAAFVITGLGGFNNAIQVVCAVPSQENMTCSATPQQITPPGTVGFVIQTFSPGQQGSTTVTYRKLPFWPRAAGGTGLAVLGFFLIPIGRRARLFKRRSTRRILILFSLLACMGGAGIGCSNVATFNSTGTPLGVATLKITASANVDNAVVSHSVYLTVNVLAPGSTP